MKNSFFYLRFYFDKSLLYYNYLLKQQITLSVNKLITCSTRWFFLRVYDELGHDTALYFYMVLLITLKLLDKLGYFFNFSSVPFPCCFLLIFHIPPIRLLETVQPPSLAHLIIVLLYLSSWNFIALQVPFPL